MQRAIMKSSNLKNGLALLASTFYMAFTLGAPHTISITGTITDSIPDPILNLSEVSETILLEIDIDTSSFGSTVVPSDISEVRYTVNNEINPLPPTTNTLSVVTAQLQIDSNGVVSGGYLDTDTSVALIGPQAIYTDIIWHINGAVSPSTPTEIINFEFHNGYSLAEMQYRGGGPFDDFESVLGGTKAVPIPWFFSVILAAGIFALTGLTGKRSSAEHT